MPEPLYVSLRHDSLTPLLRFSRSFDATAIIMPVCKNPHNLDGCPVDRILQQRVVLPGPGLQYYVRWRDLGEDSDTWVNAGTLAGCIALPRWAFQLETLSIVK
jgi:Chromo (CHRromatin Organisation MOdifier) domain